MADLSDDDLTISTEFVQQVRDLLEHLYDFPYLQKQTLVLLSTQTGRPRVEVPGQKARKLVLEALEHIGEEKSLSFRSVQARIYNLLRLHYIEGMAIQEVAQELGLSQRQTYRDLRHGDERIAAIIFETIIKQQPVTAALASAEAAVETPRLAAEPQLQPTNLNELVSTICSTVGPLAALHSVEFDLHLPPEPVIVRTDAMIARQVITGLLSLAVQESSCSPLTVRLISEADGCSLQLLFQTLGDPERRLDRSIGLYAQNLGWTIFRQGEADRVGLLVMIRTQGRTCLVIDDHAGFVELVERYVAEHKLQIVMANDGLKGIELAQQLQPNVIILDVMIPDIDGWEILQRLHATPATGAIPIVVCSVFYDPELAFTLGAAGVLKKPVRKEDLLAILAKVGIL